MEHYYSLGIYDYNREKICDLYDSQMELIGQAYQIIHSENIDGYRTLEFDIPRVIEDTSDIRSMGGAAALYGTAIFGYSRFGETDIAALDIGKNFRWDYLKSDYLIRYTCDGKNEWFVANKPSRAKAGKSIVGHVSCNGAESLLKTKSIYASFDDENGIGTAGYLMEQILKGTGWEYDTQSDTLYEADGTTEKVRSLISSEKKGALELISMVCKLFCARPVFDTDQKKVKILDINNREQVLEGEVGRNLNALTVNNDSSNMCTRVYIEGEYGDYGYVGIDDVKVDRYGNPDDEGEPWGLPFLVNFDYYRELGIFRQEHENALDTYLTDIRRVKGEIREEGTLLTACEDELNALVGQCKFAVFYKSHGYTEPARTYGFPANTTTTLNEGDSVVILKDNHTHTYEEWADNPSSQMRNAYGVVKFITKAAGKIGAAEVHVESKQKTIAQLEYKISSTTRQEKIDEYNAEIEKLNNEIQIIYLGNNDDDEGLYSMMYRVMKEDGLLYDLDEILDELGLMNDEQDDIEETFANAMGHLLRDGSWSDNNYIPGQEKCLYADAIEITKEMSRPKREYTFDYVRLTDEFDIDIEDIEINGTFHVYDKEIQVDEDLYIKRISHGVDNKSLGTIEVGTPDRVLTGGNFSDLIGKITELANMLNQNSTVYDRAKAINKEGLLDIGSLTGDFDVSKFNFYSSTGDWSIDPSGSFVFGGGGGGGSVRIGGGGVSVATDKDADGNWDYHPTVTPDGIDADDVNHGFLDPDRLDPTTGSRIDISDNSTINTINSNICAVSSAICVIDSNVGIISSNVGIINTNIAAVNSNINVLNSNINTVNSNINIVNSSINTINSNINTVNSNINTVNSNINTVNSNINTINSNINTVNSNINTVNSNINIVNSNINTINSNINTVNSNINTVNSNINTINSSINTINSSINTVNSVVNTVNSTVNTVNSLINTVNSVVNTVNSTINTVNSNINTINSNINTINSAITTINSNINTINSNICTINSNICAVNTNISTLNLAVNAINTDISTQNFKFEGINSNITTINTNIETVNTNICTLNVVVDAINTTISTQDFKFTAINTNIQTINTDICTLNVAINSINTTISTQDFKFEGINSNITAINTDICALNVAVNAINTDISTQNFKFNAINANITTINTSIEAVNTDINTLNVAVSAINTSIETQDFKFDGVNSNITAINTDICALNVAVNSINTSIETQDFKFEGINSNITAINTDISTLNLAVNSINTTISTQDFKFEGVNSSITAINTNIETVNTNISTLNLAVNAINTDISTQNFKFDGINSSITAINADISAISSQVTAINTIVYADNASICVINTHISAIDETLVAQGATIDEINSSYITIESLAHVENMDVDDLEVNTLHMFGPLYGDEIHGTFINNWDNAIEDYVVSAVRSEDGKTLTLTHASGKVINFSKATSGTVTGNWGSGTFTVTGGENELATHLTNTGHWGDTAEGEDPWVYYYKTYATMNSSPTSNYTGNHTEINASSIHAAGYSSAQLVGTWDGRTLTVAKSTSGSTSLTYSVTAGHSITYNSTTHTYSGDCLARVNATTRNTLSYDSGDQAYQDGLTTGSNNVKLAESWDGRTLTVTKSTSGSNSLTYSISAGNSITYNSTSHKYTGTCNAIVGAALRSSSSYDSGDQAYQDGNTAGYGSAKLVGTWDGRTLTITKSTAGDTSLTYSLTAGHSITYNSTSHKYTGTCNANAAGSTRSTLNYDSGDQAYQDGLTIGANNVKLAGTWSGRTLTITKSTSGDNSLTYSLTAGHSITYNSTTHTYGGTCNANVGGTTRSTLNYDSGEQAYTDGLADAMPTSVSVDGSYVSRLTWKATVTMANGSTVTVNAASSKPYRAGVNDQKPKTITLGALVSGTTYEVSAAPTTENSYTSTVTKNVDMSVPYNAGFDSAKMSAVWDGRTLTVTKSTSGSNGPLTYSVTAGHSITYNSTSHKYTGTCNANVNATTRNTLNFDSGDQAYTDGQTAGVNSVSISSIAVYGSPAASASSITVRATATNGQTKDEAINITTQRNNAYTSGWAGCYGGVQLDSTAAKTLGYGSSITVYAQAFSTSGATSRTNVQSRKITAPADRVVTANIDYCASTHTYIATAYKDTVAASIVTGGTTAYDDGWGAARSQVSLPANATGTTFKFAYPSTTVGSSSDVTYTLSVDNDYAYVKTGSNTKARVANTAYAAGVSSVTISSIAVYGSPAASASSITVRATASNGNTKDEAINITTQRNNAYASGWAGCYAGVRLNSTTETTLSYGGSVTVYAQAFSTSTATSRTNVQSRKIIAPADRTVTAGITYNSTSHKYVATAYKDSTSASTKSSGTEAFDAGVSSVTVTAGIQYNSTSHKYTAKAYKGSAEASSIAGGTEAYTAGVTAGKSAVAVTAGITYNSTSHKYTATAYKDSASASTKASGTEAYTAGVTAGKSAVTVTAGCQYNSTLKKYVATAYKDNVAASTKAGDAITVGMTAFTYDSATHTYTITASSYAGNAVTDTESATTDGTAYEVGYYKGMDDYVGTTANWNSTVQYDSSNGYYIQRPNSNNTGPEVYTVDATAPYTAGAQSVSVSNVVVNGVNKFGNTYYINVWVSLSNGAASTQVCTYTE